MFKKLFANAISRIENPYGQIFVMIAVFLFFMLRADRTREHIEDKAAISNLTATIEKQGIRIDSQNLVIQQLIVDKAEIKARAGLDNIKLINEFNAILEKLKEKARK